MTAGAHAKGIYSVVNDPSGSANHIQSETIFLRHKESKLSIFASIPHCSFLDVVRPKALTDVGFRDYIRLRCRTKPILLSYLLKEYPHWGHLLDVSHFLPDDIVGYMRPVLSGAQNMLGKIYNPGPFCSELAAEILIRLRLMKGLPSSFAPSDFLHMPQYFDEVRSAVVQLPEHEMANEGVSRFNWMNLIGVITPPRKGAHAPEIVSAFSMIKLINQATGGEPVDVESKRMEC